MEHLFNHVEQMLSLEVLNSTNGRDHVICFWLFAGQLFVRERGIYRNVNDFEQKIDTDNPVKVVV